MKKEKEKFALITGGSRGIGRAIALKIASDLNYHVLINYNSNGTAAKETVKAIESTGGKASILQFNVGDAAATATGLQSWKKENPDGIIEVIVNNAGIARDGLFMWMKPEDWHDVINTSLNGFYNVTNTLLKDILRNRYGRIVNIVSLAGLKGNPGQVNYSAAKAAMIGATKALAQEIAKRNVTVNAIAPGFIETDMTAGMDEEQWVKHIPAGRFGTVDEVADLASFLASGKASYITGEVININGGLYS
ncbi:MAG: 3-oxoacyl-ACP reductase FabG [Cytophagaceae bacterium]|nr:3-oxoacyl-ACP reductase FabG [Cytophagaceae bacterium]